MKEVRKSVYLDSETWGHVKEVMIKENKSFNSYVNDLILSDIVKKGLSENDLLMKVLNDFIRDHIDEIRDLLNQK